MIKKIRQHLSKYLSNQMIRNLVLLGFIYLLTTNILRDSIQGVENSLLVLMAYLGLALGWLLSISSVKAFSGLLIYTFSGGFLLILRVGRLGGILRILSLELGIWIQEAWSWVFQNGSTPTSSSLTAVIGELSENIFTMGTRLATWLLNVIQGNPLYDPVATAVIWGSLMWIIALWTTWFIFRHQKPLPALIPIFTLTSLSLVYTGKSPYNLVLMLGLATVILVLVPYDKHEKNWQKNNVEYDGIIRERILGTTLILALGMMLFSAVSPSFTIKSIREFFNRITDNQVNEDDFVRSLGIEPQPDPSTVSVLDSRRSGGLPNRHLIGSGEELSDQVVMIIHPEELSQSGKDPQAEENKIYYWRSLTYDRYVGRGWVSRDNVEQDYQPGEQTISSWPESYRIIRQKVEFVEDLNGLLFTAGIPLSTDSSFKVAWRVQNPDQDAYDIFGSTITADSYTADSLQPEASQIELQNAGQDYPDWIRERYLRLPESVPERVLALARDLTATEPTPYDRAVALETYLRQFPYNLELPQPPQDQDITDYFLFGVQEGYCDYYATSMVVLARAAGLPARLVTGYIGGYYAPDLDAYLVSADLAHAWVEIYFPQYGWITFEPTGGRPALDRPADPIPKFNQDYRSAFDPLVPEVEKQSIPWKWVVPGALIAVTAGIYLGFAVDNFILERLSSDKQLRLIYRRIYRYAHWTGMPTRPGDTVYQFMERLIQIMVVYGKGSREADWFLAALNPLRKITRDYNLVLYAKPGQEQISTRETSQAFRLLRPRLWYLWLLGRSYHSRVLRYFLWNTAPMTISKQIKLDR